MGWLNRLLGRKKPDPETEAQHALLERARLYITFCHVRAVVRARTERVEQIKAAEIANGKDPVAAEAAAEQAVPASSLQEDPYCQPDPMALTFMGMQVSCQCCRWLDVQEEDIRLAFDFYLLTRALRFSYQAAGSYLETMPQIHDRLFRQVVEEFAFDGAKTHPLPDDTGTMIVGIAIGNRMAQEMLTQYRAGEEPSPGDEIAELYYHHLLLRGRPMEAGRALEIDPLPFVPDVRKWLGGDESESVTIAARGNQNPVA